MTTTNSITRTIKSQAVILGGALAIMWLMYLATWMTGGALLSLGVIPRTGIGLRGIIFAPFLHGALRISSRTASPLL